MLELKQGVRTYNKDGVLKEFKYYYVLVNEIEMQLQPGDNTVRQTLEKHFEKGGK